MIRQVIKMVREKKFETGVYISLKLSPESEVIFYKYIEDKKQNF